MRTTVPPGNGSVRTKASWKQRAHQSTKRDPADIAPRAHDDHGDSPMLNIVDSTSAINQETAPFTLLGNRGVLHEGNQLVHHAVGDRWIYCVTSAMSDPRQFMSDGKVTDLFFLDEATALAAGHRPCGRRNKVRFDQFVEAWKSLRGLNTVSAEEIDGELNAHRTSGGEQVTYRAHAAELPAGVMVRELGRPRPLLLFRYEYPKGEENWCVYPWTSHGYGVKETRRVGEVEVLTPKPIVDVILTGFAPGPDLPMLAW